MCFSGQQPRDRGLYVPADMCSYVARAAGDEACRSTRWTARRDAALRRRPGCRPPARSGRLQTRTVPDRMTSATLLAPTLKVTRPSGADHSDATAAARWAVLSAGQGLRPEPRRRRDGRPPQLARPAPAVEAARSARQGPRGGSRSRPGLPPALAAPRPPTPPPPPPANIPHPPQHHAHTPPHRPPTNARRLPTATQQTHPRNPPPPTHQPPHP